MFFTLFVLTEVKIVDDKYKLTCRTARDAGKPFEHFDIEVDENTRMLVRAYLKKISGAVNTKIVDVIIDVYYEKKLKNAVLSDSIKNI